MNDKNQSLKYTNSIFISSTKIPVLESLESTNLS